MRAVVMHQTGDPDVLRVEEIDPPQPREGEVLVRVHAASINPIEWKYRRGLMPKQVPAVLGSDISGTVERSLSDAFAEGDEVFGIAATGAYAELAATPASMVTAKPRGISHEQAAALPVAGMTSWQALFDRGGLQRGQTALIAGAAGGVGHVAVQLAKKVGEARTIGIGSSANREFVLGLGADDYVDYTSQDVAEAAREVDLAFDTVGGAVTEQLLARVRRGGVLVTIAGAPPEEAAGDRGVRAELLIMSVDTGQLARIGELAAEGALHAEIAHVFPLEDVPSAHALSETGHVRGKIVLAIG